MIGNRNHKQKQGKTQTLERRLFQKPETESEMKKEVITQISQASLGITMKNYHILDEPRVNRASEETNSYQGN